MYAGKKIFTFLQVIESIISTKLEPQIKYMMMKKVIFTILTVGFLFTYTDQASAQWSLGASYENRNEDPTNGFGLRVERSVLSAVPVVDFNMRAHFSYFNEENEMSREGTTYSGDMEAYDFGLALTGGVGIGLVKPYIGLGLGAESFDFDSGDTGSFDETNLFWNGFGGLELTLLPMVSPFVEYRISKISGTDQIEFDNVSRLAVGVSLRF